MKKLTAVLAALIIAVMTLVSVSADSVIKYVSSSNGKGVRIRYEASTSADIIRNLGEATQVTVDATVDADWSKVTVRYDGYTIHGYVMSKFLSNTNPATKKQTFAEVTPFNVNTIPAEGAAGYVNFRSAASLSAAVIHTLREGNPLTVIAESGAWYKCVDTEGCVGYVVKAYVR